MYSFPGFTTPNRNAWSRGPTKRWTVAPSRGPHPYAQIDWAKSKSARYGASFVMKSGDRRGRAPSRSIAARTTFPARSADS